MVGKSKPAVRVKKCSQVNHSPALIHVWNRTGPEAVIQVKSRIDQRGFDQRRRRQRVRMRLAIILDKDRRSPGDVRPSLAGAALVLVSRRNGAPGIRVTGRLRLKRSDPCAGRHDIRFDAAILARAAAGEIRHRIRPISVNDEIDAIALGGSGSDDVLGDRRTADRLCARPSITR